MTIDPVLTHASKEVLIMCLSIMGILVFFTLLFALLPVIGFSGKFTGMKEKMRSWWIMVAVISIFFFVNRELTFIGFTLLSFVAFRELLSSMKFRQSDRSAIGLAFLSIPIQYISIYLGYTQFALLFIPVVMFLILPFRNLLSGNVKGIIHANATMQWSLMICVYSLSHMAMLFNIPARSDFSAGNLGMVLYLVFISQFNDILQFCFGKAFGKNKIIPKISPNKTWEGFLGGFFGTMISAYVFSFLTFFNWWQALVMGAMLSIAGFAGDLNISAIKRDLEIKDLGNMIEGHGGIMDRIDSLTYTGMVFFHLVNLWN